MKKLNLFAIPPVKNLLSSEQTKLINLIASSIVNTAIEKANEKGGENGLIEKMEELE